jgi:hypothetical protein
MSAESEADVVVAIASDLEPESGSQTRPRRGWPTSPRPSPLSFADWNSAQLGAARGRAPLVKRRRRPSHYFFNRLFSSTRSSPVGLLIMRSMQTP